jgi:hypothetical protein
MRPPAQLPGETVDGEVVPEKGFKRRPALERDEQRIERRVRAYLAEQYSKAADAVEQ